MIQIPKEENQSASLELQKELCLVHYTIMQSTPQPSVEPHSLQQNS